VSVRWVLSARKLLVAATAISATLAIVPGAATASSAGVALPIAVPQSWSVRPPGFTTDARQAIKAAESDPAMIALHAREHPLTFLPTIWNGQRWFIDFSYHGKRVAEVVVSPGGHVENVWTGPLALAVYARGNFATQFGKWWILVPFSILFLLPFLDPRRPLRMAHLDALAILALLGSYLLFDHAQLVPAVWTIYPPLLYLLGRMLWLGARRARERISPPDWLSVRVLTIGLVALVAARIALSLIDHLVVDVGFASVIGAHRLVHGQSLYYASTAHGDTYGPIAYLAYVPFELIFPWHGAWNYLASAHAASIVFDLVTVVGLVLLGRRLRPGEDGLRLGLALGWAWSACPFTLLALMMHTNDGLIAMLSVLSLLAFASPVRRGALLGLAAAAKFAPAALLGLYASASPRGRGLKDAAVCVASFAAVVALSIGLFLPSGGISEFYNHTIGFQLNRSDVFSVWALHPGLDPLKTAVEVLALLLAGLLAFIPRRRTLPQVCALAAAVTIALQLPAVHWFYYFIVWFIPFVLVATLAHEPTAAGGTPAATATTPPEARIDEPSPALVTA
jgi:hypothetical protein